MTITDQLNQHFKGRDDNERATIADLKALAIILDGQPKPATTIERDRIDAGPPAESVDD